MSGFQRLIPALQVCFARNRHAVPLPQVDHLFCLTFGYPMLYFPCSVLRLHFYAFHVCFPKVPRNCTL